MKKFVAVYTGSESSLAEWKDLDPAQRAAKEQAGVDAWQRWATTHADAIVDNGTPLGRTKRVTAKGIADVRNNMAAYTIVQAESHEEAASLFVDHPHFSIFPGDGVEVMECLPLPGQ